MSHCTSPTNYDQLVAAARAGGCPCDPDKDWFTYDEWQDQGMQVQRGERGARLPAHSEGESGDARTRSSSRRAVVFCRCQVKPYVPFPFNKRWYYEKKGML